MCLQIWTLWSIHNVDNYFKIVFPLPHLTLLITFYILTLKKKHKNRVWWTVGNLFIFCKIKWFYFELPIHKSGLLNEIINFPTPYCTSNTSGHVCTPRCICSARNNRYAYICMYIHSQAYTITYTCLIRLRQSLQLNWAFVKALIGPFWPNYLPLIKINPNGSSKYTKRTVYKWLLFIFLPFVSILK